jgi:hypothetical protein
MRGAQAFAAPRVGTDRPDREPFDRGHGADAKATAPNVVRG